MKKTIRVFPERRQGMKLYMSVTADEYELPVAVTDTAAELAEIYGMTSNNMLSCITRGKIRKKDKVRFVRVEVEPWD